MAAVTYSPKQAFQQDSESRLEWARIAASPLFHKALIHAQAQMAAAAPMPFEMRGAQKFIDILSNLATDMTDEEQRQIAMRKAVQLESFGPNTMTGNISAT